MKRTSLIGLAAVMLVVSAAAQNPPAPPKPGPEIEKLKYFLGDWKQEGSIAASHAPGAGKYTGTFHNVMALGGFFVEEHCDASSGMGKWSITAFLGYNAQDKVYTYDEFASTGEHTVAKGTLEGDTWTWISESKMGGKTMTGRYTEKVTSPTSYDFKFEASTDGGKTWSTFLEGKSTKVPPKPHGAGTAGASNGDGHEVLAKKAAGAARTKQQ
jgi:hypothetical protein